MTTLTKRSHGSLSALEVLSRSAVTTWRSSVGAPFHASVITRLVAEGWATVTITGDRRSMRITDAGRAALATATRRVPMTTDAYRKRDQRVRCDRCLRWMRYKPTPNTPAQRRPVPHAATCTDCPIKETP